MRRAWVSLFVTGVSFVFVGAVSVSACGGDKDRPAAESDPFATDAAPYEGGNSSGDASASAGCRNSTKDEGETDVDCGGTRCSPCVDGKKCLVATDCAGGACVSGTCATISCSNAARDGDETDIDCGGKNGCPHCGIGKHCSAASDCTSGRCEQTVCRCPAGMAEIPRPGTAAGGYCMDAVEVTKYQYDLFIKAAAATLNEQIPECRTANTSFYPRHAWPPIPGPPSGNGITADTALGFNYSLPVHYVDWCDAYAYCKWAGKQLCGGVNGGKADFAKPNQADSSAWYNACSAGGNSDWPYSTQFSSGKCNGGQGLSITLDQCGPLPQRSGYGCPEETQDLGVHYVVDGNKSGTFSNIMFSECAGGHTGVYHLSGNVAEWEDSCNGTESTSLCRVRGGSFLANNNPTAMSCKSGQTLSRVPLATGNPNTDVTRDLGIRCCSF